MPDWNIVYEQADQTRRFEKPKITESVSFGFKRPVPFKKVIAAAKSIGWKVKPDGKNSAMVSQGRSSLLLTTGDGSDTGIESYAGRGPEAEEMVDDLAFELGADAVPSH